MPKRGAPHVREHGDNAGHGRRLDACERNPVKREKRAKRRVLLGKRLGLLADGVLEVVLAHAGRGEQLRQVDAVLHGLHLEALANGIAGTLDALRGNALLHAAGELLGAQPRLRGLHVARVDLLELLAHGLLELGERVDALDVLGNPGVRGQVVIVPAALGHDAGDAVANLLVREVGDGERDLDGLVGAQRVVVVAVDEQRLGLIGHGSS